ncbi:beta ketoacyl-acyl carrier protein synthase [Tolypothrix sp. NIES-4075]|uniref:type I polyketide synthase n=1 Tax=Tolypothrix sp. NIES-4075 TaxID=2005459 RepID=UPI000B682F59|nr:type I polyketide synthase [Tolypothrix sp. NIES-4075]GAX44303.1 beta ketoacyl-acyl carrier protein synthase [Tolypothrix sp. NIES-4075]
MTINEQPADNISQGSQRQMVSELHDPIAVVGIGCWYPGSQGPQQLWENILARRREFRRIPNVRFSLEDYYDSDPEAVDKTYGQRAALIDGFVFDWAKKRIPQRTYMCTDIAQWLALDVAAAALEDAGYTRESVEHDRTGVILGNTLTGEWTRSNSMRLRWPFVRRSLLAAASVKGLSASLQEELVTTMEEFYKSVFPPTTEDTLAGGLSNTIAGRICNYFDFHGGGYTVDGACSSSLIAICTAANYLANKDLDMALAGGVDISLDTFELIGFAKTGALTKSDMNVYDRRASGFLPGEGCGFVVMKRLSDARRAGDTVYAVVRGWGISSDGKGGITAPSSNGQTVAIRRAYIRAGYSPHTLDFVEGHGTGTPVGDKTELEALAAAIQTDETASEKTCGITSLKSIIGHTKAAAGVGAFIKAAIAANRRVLPTTAGCTQPNKSFDTTARVLYPILLGKIEEPTKTLRVGVSAMGFGGINCHVTLESGDAPSQSLAPALEERALLVSNQESEVFVFGAASVLELLHKVQPLIEIAEQLSLGDLVDLAAHLGQELFDAPVRAAVVAGTPDTLADRLLALAALLHQNPPTEGEVKTNQQRDIWVGNRVQKNRLGFLMPGQGSQQLLMARVLVERYAWAREIVAQADQWISLSGGEPISSKIFCPLDRASDSEVDRWQRTLAETQVAQPAICLASILYARYLANLGIQPSVVGGHSLGELTAFHLAGAFDEADLLKLATQRGRAMMESAAQPGAMVSLACTKQEAETLVNRASGYVVVANINSPRQIVVSGEEQAVLEVMKLATEEGISAKRLRVSNAFHSRQMTAAAEQISKSKYVPQVLGETDLQIVSSMHGAVVVSGINLRQHFSTQMLAQVDFVGLVEQMQQTCDLMIEVGPGSVLSGLVKDILGNENTCLPIASQPNCDRDLNAVLASTFVHGVEVNWTALYNGRLVRPFLPATKRLFIENPCERPFIATTGLTLDPALFRAVAPAKAEPTPTLLTSTMVPSTNGKTVTEVELLELVAKRTGYPSDTVSPDSRLLDDLNLDSIKAADLVATAAKQVGVEGKLDPSQFANATIADIATAIREAQEVYPDAQIKSTIFTPTSGSKIDSTSNWVRNFSIEYVPKEAPQCKQEDWQSANVLIVADTEQAEVVKALREQLFSVGADVKTVSYSTLLQEGFSDSFSHKIAVLPRTISSQTNAPIPLSQTVARLRSIATLPKTEAGSGRKSCVAYVQFGGGDFGQTRRVVPEDCCAAAFARSLHHEQPDIYVRVIDFWEQIEPDRAASLIVCELSGTEPCTTVGYNAEGVRLEPQARLQQPIEYLRRSLTWSAQDVILVTGGAKGITAECALAVARTTGAQLALVGSSPSGNDSEVARTLERFQNAGLTCRYYSCDITDSCAVAELVATVTAELGSITAVVHGAGINKPRRISQVSVEDAVAEVSPKLLGAYNLFQALASAPPRLFIAFTSIIGVTGMPGNAWYAFSNELLDLMLRRFASDHQEMAVQAIAYSVWDDVGMAARMGSVKNLAQMGIRAIPSEEGVRRFLQLFECDPGAKQVVVAARLGGLDTWSPITLPPATGLRFVQQVCYCEPGVELKLRTRLSLAADLYVQEHVYRGSYLFPTVFGLEAMAQATAYVIGEQQPSIVRIEDISLDRPVVVDPTEGVEIELHAEVMEMNAQGERRVKVGIRTEQTGFAGDHFAATLVLGELVVGELAAPELGEALDIDPKTDLYGNLLFQGPRFQRIKSLFALVQNKCVFQSYVQAATELSSESFAPGLGSDLVLGDPYFRDVLLQSMQLTVPQDTCLPIHIEKIELFSCPSLDCGSRVVTALLQRREDREYIGEVIATSEQGYVVERLTGYRLRILEEHPENPTAVDLAFPEARDEDHLRHILQTTCKALGLSQPAVALGIPNLQGKNREQRRQQQHPIAARALQAQLALPSQEDLVFEIETLPSGKPVFSGAIAAELNISLSHDDRYCLCVVGSTPQGCDIEPIAHRTADNWSALLGVFRNSVVEELVRGGEPRDRAATRIWSALEAVRKAFNGSDPQFSVEKQQSDAVLLRTQTLSGTYFVLTLPIKLTRGLERMVALIVSEQSKNVLLDHQTSNNDVYQSLAHNHKVRYTYDGPQGQPVYEQRFQVSFKDSASISRRVSFSQYISWIGKIRELPMESIAPQLLSDFRNEWGMVTNAVSLRVLGEATSYDIIQARCWMGNVVGSSFNTYIEFCKVLPDNSLERLAIGEVKATWVRLVSYGVPSPRSFPQYLEEYLNQFSAKKPATLDLKNPATLNLSPLPASLSQLEAGQVVYDTPPGPNGGKVLRTETFQTTLEESNLVGNVYYGNYFIWQGRVRDLFLYSIAPEYLRVSEPHGEMICLYSRMDYLREAMPFDRVRVILSVQSVFMCGAIFSFEFFREQPDGQMQKLQVGQQEVVWVERLADGTPIAHPWPEVVMHSLLERSSQVST